jgi:cell division septum initiation protein DivIVA
MIPRPTPITRPGLDILADELGRAFDQNSELQQENIILRQKIEVLEQQIRDLSTQTQVCSTSGTNN